MFFVKSSTGKIHFVTDEMSNGLCGKIGQMRNGRTLSLTGERFYENFCQTCYEKGKKLVIAWQPGRYEIGRAHV